MQFHILPTAYLRNNWHTWCVCQLFAAVYLNIIVCSGGSEVVIMSSNHFELETYQDILY